MDEHLKQRDVNDWLAEHQARWDAMTPEEQEVTIAKNKAANEEWERKNAGKSIDQIAGEALAESMGLPDWTYTDLPKITQDVMDEFVESVGSDNLKWITMAQYKNWGPEKLDLVRGQVLISPAGMQILKEKYS